MGFFSTVFNVVKSVGRAVLGIPAPVKVAVAAAPALASRTSLLRRGASLAGTGAALGIGAGAGLGVVRAGGQIISGGDGGAGAVGGNGDSFRRTLVQTVDRATGEVESTIVLRGAPFVMRHDIQIAKRVIRMASKLGKMKGIRHTVRQSVVSRTKDAIEAKVLAQVTKEC